MAYIWVDGELITAQKLNQYGEDIVAGVSPTVSISKVGKVTTITITDIDGEHTATINDGQDGSGTGDMLKTTYDTNDNGIVDNSEAILVDGTDTYKFRTGTSGAEGYITIEVES